MAGPTVMALGPFAFEAYGFSFTERESFQDTPWASIPVAGSMNALQWTGGESATELITGVLFPAELGGAGSLAGVEAAAAAGTVLPLVAIGDGFSTNILNMWVVESVEKARGFINANGVPMRMSYTIALRGYPIVSLGGFSPASIISYF